MNQKQAYFITDIKLSFTNASRATNVYKMAKQIGAGAGLDISQDSKHIIIKVPRSIKANEALMEILSLEEE